MTGGRTRPLTAIVCDSDPLRRVALADRATSAGFEIQHLVDNGPHALDMVPFSQPSLLLMVQELIGMSGLEVVPIARRMDGAPDVILIASDESIAEQARDEGAIAVVRHGDDDRLDVVLADLAEQFRTGERRGIDRRERPDRRVKQEWNKVTMERRSGVDRRAGDTRDDAG